MAVTSFRFLVVAAFAALLCGCSSSGDSSTECPSAAVLASTSSMTVFKGGDDSDPANELYTVAATNVATTCSYDSDAEQSDSSIVIRFAATRPAAGAGVGYKIPYYVAVMKDGQILSKKNFWVEFGFADGEASTNFSDSIASTVLKIDPDKKPYDYQFLVGLQLSHSQLDYNSKTGRMAP